MPLRSASNLKINTAKTEPGNVPQVVTPPDAMGPGKISRVAETEGPEFKVHKKRRKMTVPSRESLPRAAKMRAETEAPVFKVHKKRKK